MAAFKFKPSTGNGTLYGGGHGMSWRSDCTPYPALYTHPAGSPESVRRELLADIGQAYFSGPRRGNLGWQDDAVCLQSDPDAWFDGSAAEGRIAKRICNTVCPVRAECLEDALKHNKRHGIAGGLSVEERQALQRERRKAQRQAEEEAA